MQKGRNQVCSTVWEGAVSSPAYLDSAYKQLLRQDLKANALKNRTKVLNLHQGHLLKLVDNQQQKQLKLSEVKENHSNDIRKLRQDKEMKTLNMQQQKNDNTHKRHLHMRQMSHASLQKSQHLSQLKRDALRLRKENTRLIQLNREKEIEKKREVRNKIHNDIMESRATVQQFFVNKHAAIIETNKLEIDKINKKRVKQEEKSLAESGVRVKEMEKELREMKCQVREGRELAPRYCRQKSSKKEEESHPLLRRIDNVMSRYVKIS